MLARMTSRLGRLASTVIPSALRKATPAVRKKALVIGGGAVLAGTSLLTMRHALGKETPIKLDNTLSDKIKDKQQLRTALDQIYSKDSLEFYANDSTSTIEQLRILRSLGTSNLRNMIQNLNDLAFVSSRLNLESQFELLNLLQPHYVNAMITDVNKLLYLIKAVSTHEVMTKRLFDFIGSKQLEMVLGSYEDLMVYANNPMIRSHSVYYALNAMSLNHRLGVVSSPHKLCKLVSHLANYHDYRPNFKGEGNYAFALEYGRQNMGYLRELFLQHDDYKSMFKNRDAMDEMNETLSEYFRLLPSVFWPERVDGRHHDTQALLIETRDLIRAEIASTATPQIAFRR